jgi:uncharacterized protein (UPF0332 family)
MVLPEDFLNYAKRITDPRNNPTEMDYRTGISRAYYALFHLARQKLLARNSVIEGTEAHKKVAEALGEINQNIGGKFKSFRDYRNNADYDLTSSFCNASNTKDVIEEITRFIKKVDDKI